MSNTWYLLDGQKQVGPMTLEALKALRARGQVGDAQFVWTHGMPNWIRASEVPALAPANDRPPVAPNNCAPSQTDISSQKKPKESGNAMAPNSSDQISNESTPDRSATEPRKPKNEPIQRKEESNDSSGCFFVIFIAVSIALYYISSWWDERNIIHNFVESNIEEITIYTVYRDQYSIDIKKKTDRGAIVVVKFNSPVRATKSHVLVGLHRKPGWNIYSKMSWRELDYYPTNIEISNFGACNGIIPEQSCRINTE